MTQHIYKLLGYQVADIAPAIETSTTVGRTSEVLGKHTDESIFVNHLTGGPYVQITAPRSTRISEIRDALQHDLGSTLDEVLGDKQI